ncbi:hypothetical protein [Thermococcus sp.]
MASGHSEGLQGAGQVILVAIVGVEGSVEGVRIVNGEWLAETFNRYSIEPLKKTLLEKLISEKKKENKYSLINTV